MAPILLKTKTKPEGYHWNTVFSVNLVCKKELYLTVNKHDNNEMRKFENTHSKGEQVKIPLLPNRVGKRSGTMVTTTPYLDLQ